MERSEITYLKGLVPCAAVLDKAGFVIDLKESTRRAVKYRRDGEIVIVIHKGKCRFDLLSEARGDVFSLVAHLHRVPFAEALDGVAALVG